MRNLFFLFAFLWTSVMVSQELNCTVNVIAQQTGNENDVIYKTLEKQLSEFINNTEWTRKRFETQERINCSMVINITEQSNNLFSASLQVSSSRPIYNSTYSSPVYNYNDKNFNFEYLEFQNLVFNENQFESNLISVLSFHVYMILGMDADTFELNGGNPYFEQAQTIASYSQKLNGQGWKLEDGLQSRFALINNLMSPSYKDMRLAMYKYHIEGLDIMYEDVKKGKSQIIAVLDDLQNVHRARPNSYLMRVFFDAKADEILDILSGGPSVNITNAMDILNRIAPMHSQKWRNIQY
ncbi:type IX secretion system protein PorD [Winogradskyella sp. PC D3.3]